MVNHRPEDAIKLMQRTLGLVADGVIGPKTKAAYQVAVDNPSVVWQFIAQREDLYCDIVANDFTQIANLKGWIRRAHGLAKLTLP